MMPYPAKWPSLDGGGRKLPGYSLQLCAGLVALIEGLDKARRFDNAWKMFKRISDVKEGYCNRVRIRIMVVSVYSLIRSPQAILQTIRHPMLGGE